MKKSRDSRLEGLRTGGIHEMRDSAQEGFRTRGIQERRVPDRRDADCGAGEMLDRRETGHVGCRTCGTQDAGLQRCRKGGIQERRNARKEECGKGGM